MCGIAGILDPGSGADPGRLERMIGAVRHRGPDDVGIHAEGPVGLAHARLSIIDPEGGHQPMSNDDGSVWLAFNGEIFNYVELREMLVARGWRFGTRSDTEVLLRLYEDRGLECVHALNGQWAFALWDARRRRLVLSRDRVGVLPLYWSEVGGRLTFGSEVKALFGDPRVPRRLDPKGLDQTFTFWHPVPPRTPFEAVRELPPAHNLVVEDGRARLQRYWDVDFGHPEPPGDEGDDAHRLLEALEDATRIRLRADVPVGAYLSGGLDSSVISALVSRVHPQRLRTFSVSFSDAEFDEARYQEAMVRHLGTEHHRVRIGPADIARVFGDVVWHAEKPMLRTAPAPLFLLSELVRQSGYKVVLTGEGADEFLGGYDLFKETRIREFWARQPESRLRPLLLRRLYPWLPRMQAQSPAFLQAFFQPGDVGSPWFSHLPRWRSAERIKVFYSPEMRAALDGWDAREELAARLPAGFEGWDVFGRAQYLEATGLLPAYLLSSQGDRMLMAHSVEGRFPFLDHRVIELAARLPRERKMKVLDEKHLLKRAARELLPREVLERPKQPYRAPDAAAFLGPQAGEAEWVRELLSPARLEAVGVFDPERVGLLVRKADAGRAAGARDNMALVGVLSTQILASRLIQSSTRWTHGSDRTRNQAVPPRQLPLR